MWSMLKTLLLTRNLSLIPILMLAVNRLVNTEYLLVVRDHF